MSNLNVSRRNFVVGSAAALAAGAVAGGATSAFARIPSNAADLDANGGQYPMSIDEDAYFAAPEPITDIAETYDYDVVVVGAGASGVPAACAAADYGAKVAVLQKSPRVYSHGILFSAWGAPSMEANKGIEFDAETELALKQEFMAETHYGCQADLLNRFFEETAEAAEWHIGQVQAAGKPMWMNDSADNPMMCNYRCYDQVSLTHQAIADNYADKVDWYWSTPGLQLVQDADGAVTGIVAQDRDGNYLQFNAAKGVILATGGFGGNKELVARWLPSCVTFPNGCYPEDNTGDGALMAIWAGAAKAPLISKKIDIRFYGDNSARTNIEKLGFLLVNDQGRRVGNERATEMQNNNFCALDPSESGCYYCIFDANYGAMLEANGQDRAILGDEQLEEYLRGPKPLLWQADSLPELAEAIGVPAEQLEATVARYNELADMGEDVDFYKDASWLHKIEEGPFYAMVRQYTIGGTLGAIKVTADAQAVSRFTGEPIPGLYVVGNDMGGLQGGQDYVWHDYGMTLTSGVTFGHMVGRNLALA